MRDGAHVISANGEPGNALDLGRNHPPRVLTASDNRSRRAVNGAYAELGGRSRFILLAVGIAAVLAGALSFAAIGQWTADAGLEVPAGLGAVRAQWRSPPSGRLRPGQRRDPRPGPRCLAPRGAGREHDHGRRPRRTIKSCISSPATAAPAKAAKQRIGQSPVKSDKPGVSGLFRRAPRQW